MVQRADAGGQNGSFWLASGWLLAAGFWLSLQQLLLQLRGLPGNINKL